MITPSPDEVASAYREAANPGTDFLPTAELSTGSITSRLDAIETRQIALDAKLESILTIVSDLINEAKPVIEQVQNSPLVRMLTGG